MNQLDVLLLVLFLPFTFRGYFRGLCREIFGLAGAIAGVLAAGAKGPALMGFTLLLIERAAPASAVSRMIAESELGRPLEHMAGTVAETGQALGILPGEQHA